MNETNVPGVIRVSCQIGFQEKCLSGILLPLELDFVNDISLLQKDQTAILKPSLMIEE